MNDLLTKSLAQIVNNNHRAAGVFEKHHLDFCCKGKRSLQQACAEIELSTDKILAELKSNETGHKGKTATDFNTISLSQLVEYIVTTHHEYVKKEMPAIAMYLQKIAAKHGEHHPEMLKVFELFMAVKEEMEQHMQKEEVVLFPRIKELEKQLGTGNSSQVNISYLKAPIHMMEQEHEHAGDALAEIRKLTSNFNPPADACTTYRLSFAALEAFELNLHQHVHLENNILFPKALHLFGELQKVALN